MRVVLFKDSEGSDAYAAAVTAAGHSAVFVPLLSASKCNADALAEVRARAAQARARRRLLAWRQAKAAAGQQHARIFQPVMRIVQGAGGAAESA